MTDFSEFFCRSRLLWNELIFGWIISWEIDELMCYLADEKPFVEPTLLVFTDGKSRKLVLVAFDGSTHRVSTYRWVRALVETATELALQLF